MLMLAALADPGVYGERLTIILGYVALASVVAVFASCRTFISLMGRLGARNLVEAGWYRPFNRYHGYYWWIFLFALVNHLLTTLMHTGFPTAGDPDAASHWVILSLGFGSLLAVGVTLSSCRSIVGLARAFTEKDPLASRGFRAWYRIHSPYWIVLGPIVIVHVISAYLHAGIWPG